MRKINQWQQHWDYATKQSNNNPKINKVGMVEVGELTTISNLRIGHLNLNSTLLIGKTWLSNVCKKRVKSVLQCGGQMAVLFDFIYFMRSTGLNTQLLKNGIEGNIQRGAVM